MDSDVLRDAARQVLFTDRSIGPVDWIVERALVALSRSEDDKGMVDDQLVDAWRTEARAAQLRFLNEPNRYDHPAAMDFISGCSIVFGLDEEQVPRLLRKFHDLDHADRLALFHVLRPSPRFAYLGSLLENEAPTGEHSPSGASVLRALMKVVFASS